MENPRIPDDEERRLAALAATNMLFSPSEERFDRVTRLASFLFSAPISLVTLVADKCQWFKSAQGLAACETSREISFCAHAILSEETLVVENATEDRRFFDNPLVTGEPNICFYAGHPIHAEDGSRIGTLCVIDSQPRVASPQQLNALRDLASIVESELQRGQLSDAQREWFIERDELQRKAAIDGLTRLWNRSVVMEILASELGRVKRGVPVCVAMIDADHFKNINDTHGHPVGDTVLVELAARIRRAVREYDSVGRYGGEEFIAVLGNCDIATAQTVCERIRSFVEQETIDTTGGALRVTVSIGVTLCDCDAVAPEAAVAAADAALYRAKHNGRNRVEVGHLDHKAVEQDVRSPP